MLWPFLPLTRSLAGAENCQGDGALGLKALFKWR